MEKLKLIAFDAEDLAVISAHLQDAVVNVSDIAYLPNQKRFAAIANRFHWTHALSDGDKTRFAQCGSLLRLERVLAASLSGIDLADTQQNLSLLALHFNPHSPDDPEGFVTLYFNDGKAIRLHVECVEAELRDLEPDHEATHRPNSQDDEMGAG